MFYLLAYKELRLITIIDIPLFWGVMALFLASFTIIAIQRILVNLTQPDALKQRILAHYAIAGTFLISLALAIELDVQWYSLALALEIMALAWLSTMIPLNIFRSLCTLALILFALLLIPQALTVFKSAIGGSTWLMASSWTIPIVKWPLWQLGIPILSLAGSSYLMRQRANENLVRGLDIVSAILTALFAYIMMRYVFHGFESGAFEAQILYAKTSMTERGLINIVFITLAGLVFLTRKFHQRSFLLGASIGLICFTLFRIGYLDLLIHNPYWRHEYVGTAPIFNNLLLAYAIPAGMLYTFGKLVAQSTHKQFAKFSAAISFPLLFIYLNFAIRQYYQGPYLNAPTTSDAELYTYSIVWVVLGIVLLVIGLIRQHVGLRYASLAIMVIAVLKVFLIDASKLTGLLRVVSFLGLGMSLLGLGYLYQRFVVKNNVPKSKI